MKKKQTYALLLAMVGCVSTAWADTALPSSNPQVRVSTEGKGEAAAPIVPQLAQQAATVTGAGQFILQGVVFTGDTSVRPQDLQPLVTPYIGKAVTLGDLEGISAKVTAYLRAQGYPAGTAFLPPQENDEGFIEIRILLGALEEVQLTNHSRLKDSVAAGIVKHFPKGATLTNEAVVPTLRQLQNIPGIKVQGNLTPGKTVGATDLQLTLTDAKRIGGYVYADNYGQTQSGRNRLGVQVAFYNPTGYGDVLSLGGLWSNENLRNYMVNYDRPIGSDGTHVGITYSRLNYSLGSGLATSNTEGLAKTLGFYGSTPLRQSATSALSLTYGYNYRILESDNRYQAIFGQSRKAHSHAMNLGLSGYTWSPKTYIGYNVSGTWGTLQREVEAVGVSLVNTPQGIALVPTANRFSGGEETGTFYKLNTDITYSRSVAPRWRLQFNWHSQLANHSLDGSEQFVLGGPNGVRAYATNSGGGDSGYQATLALQYQTKVPGLTLSPFLDWGETTLKGTVATNSPSAYHLAGYGLALQYQPVENWNLSLTYARQMKAFPLDTEENRSKGRWWVQSSYRF